MDKALPTIAMVEVWKGIGFWTLLFLAGLKSLPLDLFYAAELDGAGPLRRFVQHTAAAAQADLLLLDHLRDNRQTFSSSTSSSFSTHGGPARSTVTVTWYVYRSLFTFNQPGYGATVAFVLVMVVLTLTFIQSLHLQGEALDGGFRNFRRRQVRALQPGMPAILTSYALLILACAISLVPFFYVLSTSLKNTRSLFSDPPQWIPKELFWGNYGRLLSEFPFLEWTVNSLLVGVAITVIKLVVNSMAAYALAKLDFPGKSSIVAVLLLAVAIPVAALVIPLFSLRFAGSRTARQPWLPGLAPYATFAPPPDAVAADVLFPAGAGGALSAPRAWTAAPPFQAFRRVVLLPLVGPGLRPPPPSSSFIFSWNEFLGRSYVHLLAPAAHHPGGPSASSPPSTPRAAWTPDRPAGPPWWPPPAAGGAHHPLPASHSWPASPPAP